MRKLLARERGDANGLVPHGDELSNEVFRGLALLGHPMLSSVALSARDQGGYKPEF